MISTHKLLDVVERISTTGLDEIKSNGFVIPGHNGLYHDPETPVRNTAHWLITWAKLYELTGSKDYAKCIEIGSDFLLKDENRPYGFTLYCRNSPVKDKCNGLIGQAWAIEGLVSAYRIIQKEEYLNLAIELFKLHPYDSQLGLWRIIDIDGRDCYFDPTFNHQLWFAFSGALLQEHDPRIAMQVQNFLDRLDKNLTIFESGLIYHPIVRLESLRKQQIPVAKRIKSFIKQMVKPGRKNQNQSKLLEKSIGYHAFNTYAMAVMKPLTSNHLFWRSNGYRKILDYLITYSYKSDLNDNIYGYPYNPPGFEIPVSLDEHFLNKKKIDPEQFYRSWIQRQFDKSLNSGEWRFTRNNEDPATLTARLYELMRLPERYLKTVEIEIKQYADG